MGRAGAPLPPSLLSVRPRPASRMRDERASTAQNTRGAREVDPEVARVHFLTSAVTQPRALLIGAPCGLRPRVRQQNRPNSFLFGAERGSCSRRRAVSPAIAGGERGKRDAEGEGEPGRERDQLSASLWEHELVIARKITRGETQVLSEVSCCPAMMSLDCAS